MCSIIFFYFYFNTHFYKFQDEVNRLKDEIIRERGMREEERERWVKETDQVRKIARERAESEIQTMKEDLESTKRSLHKRHQTEIKNVKSTEETDRNKYLTISILLGKGEGEK